MVEQGRAHGDCAVDQRARRSHNARFLQRDHELGVELIELARGCAQLGERLG